jgi:hypothetical protein
MCMLWQCVTQYEFEVYLCFIVTQRQVLYDNVIFSIVLLKKNSSNITITNIYMLITNNTTSGAV